MPSFDECFQKVKADCFKFISSQETKTEKFKNKGRMIRSFLIPICFWISKKASKKKPLIIGLAGGQGIGKTTITSIITIILKKYFKLNAFKISIDDFYKTRKQRILLSKNKHPLLMTRGVPGTHDINIILNFFRKIKVKKFKSLKLPKPDVVIFEGWCVGAKSQNFRQLRKPINSLERIQDQTFKWRRYVNYQLETKYKKLFNQLDGLLYLRAKNFSLLRRWRLKQEKKLWLKSKNKKNLKIMNKDQVKNFMDTYQRITQQMFKDMPKYSSIIMNLNSSHQIKNIRYRYK